MAIHALSRATAATVLSAAIAAGCGPTEAQRQTDEIRAARTGENLTAGTVQRKIEKGMPSAEVVEALGSPNILSTDAEGRQVWVYERFARDVTTSDSWTFLIFWGAGNQASSVSERSLTVIVKFDEDERVRDVAYHATNF